MVFRENGEKLMHLLDCSIQSLLSLMQKRQLSAKELCQFYLNRIEKLNPSLNAVLAINAHALEKAQDITQNWDQYKDLPLAGIPVLLKDVFCIRGAKTTAGSKILENFISPYSSEVALRLEKAGAIFLGKCNQDEFAMGTSNENSAFGPVLNPWNKAYVPGGSSGGSAAAVSAGLCAISIGTDTGGSIRQPSAFCNLVGLKPTYGRISRFGIIAYSSSLDQAGPMTMSVEDNALVLSVLSGKDEKDATSFSHPVPDWKANISAKVKGLRVAWLNKEQVEKSCSSAVLKALKDTAHCLKSHGAVIKEVSVPLLEMSLPVYYLISTSEASSNLARYDGVRYGYRFDFKDKKPSSLEEFYSQTRGKGFGHEVKRRIIMGTYCLSSGYYDAYYNKASCLRRQIRDQLVKAFSQVDVFLAPVSADTAFKLGQNPAGSLESYLLDSFTVSANLAGLPALSVPAGFSAENDLPVGVQLIANHFDEQTLFNTAYLIEQELKAAGQRPNFGK